MAKISTRTAITAIAGTEKIPAEQGGTTKYATISQLLANTKADAAIADAITKKHTQNSDTILDEGGANEVAVSVIKPVTDNFDAEDSYKALPTLFKQLGGHKITTGAITISSTGTITIATSAFIFAPSLAKNWVSLPAGTYTIAGSQSMLVAVVNPTTYAVTIEEWTWNADAGKTVYNPTNKYANNVIPIAYKLAGVVYHWDVPDYRWDGKIATDGKLNVDVFRNMPNVRLTSGSITIDNNSSPKKITVNNSAWILAPTYTHQFLTVPAGDYTFTQANFSILVAKINTSTFAVTVEEWTYASQGALTTFTGTNSTNNIIVPLAYYKAGKIHRVWFDDFYDEVRGDIDVIDVNIQGCDDVTPAAEDTEAGYYVSDGTITANANWQSARYDVTDEAVLYFSGTTGGGATYAARYFNSSNVQISAEYQGTNGVFNVLRNVRLTIPTGTAWIGLTAYTYAEWKLLKPNGEYRYLMGADDVEDAIQNGIGNLSSGKTIVWFGTSIPAQGYPALVGAAINATVFNEALGSSMARATKYDSSWVGMNYKNLLRSLSHTLAEKQHIMDNWTTNLDSTGKTEAEGGTAPFTFGWRDLLAGTPPADYTTDASAATILSWSYEKKLVAKYLDVNSEDFVAAPDIFVLDHGHNDLANEGWDESDEAAIAVPTTRNDRSRFIGAMNYLIDVILSYNPRARIFLIGHYEKARKGRIYQAQENLFSYWDFPHIKLWEKLGWTQQEVTTTGYWENSTTWHDSGGEPQTLTLTEVWMYDDLHPASTAAKQLIANNLLELFKNNA